MTSFICHYTTNQMEDQLRAAAAAGGATEDEPDTHAFGPEGKPEQTNYSAVQ